ncbi:MULTISPECIES: hypothetical protein [Streptomyces]|uniref:hypothetical protein n=1 Tax=Streptomyces lycopersici TaxID=2974589 RepID=UPI0021D1088A|nr:hypothetical protein [Streptomyces sp. NEAU-383]
MSHQDEPEPEQQVAQDVVFVESGMFLLAEPGTADVSFTPDNGLVFTNMPGVTVVVTGIATGDVNVTVEVRRDAPRHVELDTWDEVVDQSLTAPTGNVRVRGLADDPPDLPLLTPYGPGTYRVRVHARGRDTAPDGATFEPVEDYRIIIWSAPQVTDTVHKQTDAVGSSWRRST